MFDVGFSELILLAVVALVVLGPEKLPHAARIAGAWVGRIRRSVSAMQAEIEREVAAQEMKSRLEKEFHDVGGSDIVRELQQEKRILDSELQQMRQELSQPLSTPLEALPTDDKTPLLPQANVPLEQIEVDGEKAYREWLQAQKRPRPAGNTSPDSTDSPAP